MRRAFKGRSDAFVRSEQGEQGFWPSYADMMSAVALILFFLMLLSYTQNIITGNNLRATQAALTNTEETLSVTQSNLEMSQQNLRDAQRRLAETQQQVESAKAELEQITSSLDAARTQLAQQQADLESQNRQLSDQAALISAQQAYVDQASEELVNMRNQMHQLAFLRTEIIKEIGNNMISALGDASQVSVSETGSLVLKAGVLFDSGSYEIKKEAEPTLDYLIDAFAKVLADQNNQQYIDSIIISGHTDHDGTNWRNRILSTDRANAVLQYMLEGRNGTLESYASFFSAAGYGEERPIAGTDQSTDEGKAANRRIEISIVLRDDSILDAVNAVLALGDLPEGVSADVTTVP